MVPTQGSLNMVNSRTTLGFALVFIGLAFFVLYDMGSLSEKRKEKAADEKRILRDADQFAEWIEISAAPDIHKEKIRFECREANKGCSMGSNMKWEITQPEVTDSDSVNVGSILATLESLRVSNRVEIDEKMSARDWRAEFGLSKAKLILTIKFQSRAEPVRIEFGDEAAAGSDQYAFSSLDPKYILSLPNYVAHSLDRDFFHWRNKQILPGIDIDEVVKMSWSHHQVATPFKMERVGKTWRFTAPKSDRADGTIALGLLNALVNWTAHGVIPDAASIGKDRWLTATLETKNGKTATVEVFPLADKTKFVARSSLRRWLGEVHADEINRFSRTFPELRDRKLLSADEDARSVAAEWQFPGPAASGHVEKLSFKRNGKDWDLLAEANAKVLPSKKKYGAIFSLLMGSHVLEFIPDSLQMGAGWPKDSQWLVRFFDEKQKLVREFHFFSDHKKLALTEGENPHELRKLSPKFAENMPFSVDELQEKPQENLQEKAEGKQ